MATVHIESVSPSQNRHICSEAGSNIIFNRYSIGILHSGPTPRGRASDDLVSTALAEKTSDEPRTRRSGLRRISRNGNPPTNAWKSRCSNAVCGHESCPVHESDNFPNSTRAAQPCTQGSSHVTRLPLEALLPSCGLFKHFHLYPPRNLLLHLSLFNLCRGLCRAHELAYHAKVACFGLV